jgi:hypothetical protein
MTLLHLVGEQRLQNLIPLLALEPSTVVQVLSGSVRFSEVASHLEEAVGSLLPEESRPQFHRVVLESHAPSIEDTRSAVALALKNHGIPAVVNITGGTKPMSIGAFLAAEDFGVPALYYDHGFHSTGVQALPGMKSLADVLNGLTVPSLLAAHGVPAARLLSTIPGEAELEFGRIAAKLDTERHATLKSYLLEIRRQLYPSGDNKAVPKGSIESLLADGLPQPSDPDIQPFLEAAVNAGYLQIQNGRFHYAIDSDWNTRQKHDKTIVLSRTLVGGWFELHCFSLMSRSGDFSDLLTGVQAKGTRVLGETDIVGVDRNGSLVFVSCKADDQALKPLDHVFALRQRAREFGGSHARAILRIGRVDNIEKQKTIQESCLALGVELHVGLEDASTSADIPKMVKTTSLGNQSNP